METPSYSHLTSKDYDYIYEPSEDSFLLLDALELELNFLLSRKPLVSVEIGPGSGIIISALSKYLDYQSHGFFATDINNFACDATSRTAKANNVNVEVINMDLLTAFKSNSIDLLVFNPPYVPTFSDESACDKLEQNKFYDKDAEETFLQENEEKMLIKSWAGGKNGCETINRLINNLNNIMAPNGIFYLVVIKENDPERIKQQINQLGFSSHQVIDRKIRGEHLFVLRFIKNV